MRLGLISAAAALTLAGCATPTPFSYIDGNKYHRAEMNTYSVIVLDVDGKSYLQHPVMSPVVYAAVRPGSPRATWAS